MINGNALILSVAEMRKLASGSLDNKSDDEVEQLIIQLDFLAELFLKGVIARKESAYKKED